MQRFRLALNNASEIPRYLNTHLTGLVGHLNLCVDPGRGVFAADDVLAGLKTVIEHDGVSANPYELRSVLFNLSHGFLRAMAAIQAELTAAPPVNDQAEQQDWGQDLRGEASPVWTLNAPHLPLRTLLVMELHGWCKLSSLVCEGGIPDIVSFARPILSSIAATRDHIRLQKATGQVVDRLLCKIKAGAKWGEKLVWALAPLESYLRHTTDENANIAASRLMLYWGPVEPDSFTKANFLNLMWWYVDRLISEAGCDPTEKFLLVYAIVERFDVCP